MTQSLTTRIKRKLRRHLSAERRRNIQLLIRMIPRLVFFGRERRLFLQMMAFCRTLPQRFAQPLPVAMQDVALPAAHAYSAREEKQRRDLADLAAAVERRSLPGICMRRSLTRYRFLSEIGMELEVVFGARLKQKSTQRGIAGHAWLLHDSHVYSEAAEHVQPYTPIYRWPPP